MSFSLVPHIFVFFFNNIFFIWWQMIVVIWCVSLTEMSSNIVKPNMKVFFIKNNKINLIYEKLILCYFSHLKYKRPGQTCFIKKIFWNL